MPASLRQQVAFVVRRVPLLIKVVYYAYRFFQPKFTIGVVGLVFNAQHEILLVEHVFHPKLPWGLPGGWVKGELPTDTGGLAFSALGLRASLFDFT